MTVTCMNAILLHKFVKICLYLHMTALVAVAEGVVCTAHVKVTRLWLRQLSMLRRVLLARTD